MVAATVFITGFRLTAYQHYVVRASPPFWQEDEDPTCTYFYQLASAIGKKHPVQPK